MTILPGEQISIGGLIRVVVSIHANRQDSTIVLCDSKSGAQETVKLETPILRKHLRSGWIEVREQCS